MDAVAMRGFCLYTRTISGIVFAQYLALDPLDIGTVIGVSLIMHGNVADHNRTEIFVGLAVLIGIVCLAYVAIGLGRWYGIGLGGYIVYGDFASVSGLNIGDPVEVAGVKVGTVESIRLTNGYEARVGLKIKKGVTIYENAIATIDWEGLVGDKSVSIDLGSPANSLEPGDEILTKSQPSLQDLVGQLVAGDLV